MTETEKNHSFQRVQLMKQAAVIRQNNGMNRHDALVTAHRIGALIRQMHHGNVCFRYTKQDGTIRHATGTLTGYEHSFHRPYLPKPENTFVVYYDIEAKGWRTFHAENFLDIEDSLYEAIRGCREELEFLIHCAERLEPHTEEEEETPFNTYRPQRFSAPESAV